MSAIWEGGTVKKQVFIHAQKDGLVQERTYIQNTLAKAYASHLAYCKYLP